MKTKDFIKMLQEEDPSGEGHIRMDGGIPFTAVLKEGYWDGPYTYIDDDENYVLSTEGYKVDIYCMEVWDFVETNMDRHSKWEDIKKKFKFKLGYVYNEQRDEKSNRVLKEAKEAFDFLMDLKIRVYEKGLSEMIENAKKGWRWFQNIDVDKNEKPNMYKYYNWKIFDEKGKEQGSNVHMTESVQDSGLWEKVESAEIAGYYEWIYKNKN